MRSYTAIWGIVITGLVGLLSFGGLALWNSNSTMAKLRRALEVEHKVTIERLKVSRDGPDGTALTITIGDNSSKQTLSDETMKQVAINALAFLYRENPRLELTRLDVLYSEQKLVLNRLLIMSYLRARSHQDTMVLTLASEGYITPEVEVTGLTKKGVTLKVSVEESEKHKSSEVSSKFLLRKLTIKRYQRLFAVAQVRVEFRGNKIATSWNLTPNGQVYANSKMTRTLESAASENSSSSKKTVQPAKTDSKTDSNADSKEVPKTAESVTNKGK